MKTLGVTGAWTFRAGEAVPGWLLDQEPTRPDTQAAAFTFEVDCEVIETAARYIVAPLQPSPNGVLRLSRGGGLRISAPGRSVQLVTDFQHIAGPDEAGGPSDAA